MKVFTDMHHGELFYSLQLLFEGRLGWELYRPIGIEWYNEGFWNIFPHPGTAQQFLATDQAVNPPRGMEGKPFPEHSCFNRDYTYDDGIYYVKNPTKDKVHAAITLEKFKDTNFDIIISSIPQHIGPFNRLISDYQPGAKHIFQVGNAWGQQPGVRNILASTAPFPTPSDINIVFYHQEFDLNWFSYEPPTTQSTVHSYIHWMQRKDLMDQYASLLPGWTFRAFGAGMDEDIAKTQDVAQKMKESAFTWHYKPEGDGYGHGVFSSYACGRPAIIWKPFYNGKLAEALLIDNQTCIDISKYTPQQGAEVIRRFSVPGEHRKMCESAHNRFHEVVNFDEQEQLIRTFLRKLI
jgi:hypothetical protein